MRRLHSRNSKGALRHFRSHSPDYREYKTLPSFGPPSDHAIRATEDKYEVVVPVDAMVSIDTFVQLFLPQAFCVIANVHHS
jgi:hypothetical protein